MSEPSPEQSFSIHLKSLTDFADEFTTQIQSLQAPMDHLATMSATAPQYGAFHEAWSLGAGEQAAVEEMFSLLGQVRTAIAFAGDVTGTVADGYRNADEDAAYGMGGPPGSVYGNGGGGNSWHDGHHYGYPAEQDQGQNQNQYGGDQSQNHQGGHDHGAPVPNQNSAGPWVPNQNTSGPFAVSPVTAVPLAGALLGGALLGGAAKSRSNQSPGNSAAGATVEASFEGSSSAPAGALPLWTPPPDAGTAPIPPPPPAPAPVFPGQDASGTATTQGGTRP